MKIKYSSNNSGGKWWLSDKDWFALRDGGWDVKWVVDDAHRQLTDGRWLGALAKEALTGADVSDEGCNCCGPPHCFSWEGEFGVEGESCLTYMFKKVPRSLREACE
jgi:hypothetical protein